ncbi:MAG TPA: PAS domain S-box protein [Candidatus Paceibacterota bacterium]|nr:PAS domain S-box protein [Verrucomicrobiota bacterium]HRY48690.1 PAS domain S-box protein [Candidatus Paceibacterota bacterium]
MSLHNKTLSVSLVIFYRTTSASRVDEVRAALAERSSETIRPLLTSTDLKNLPGIGEVDLVLLDIEIGEEEIGRLLSEIRSLAADPLILALANPLSAGIPPGLLESGIGDFMSRDQLWRLGPLMRRLERLKRSKEEHMAVAARVRRGEALYRNLIQTTPHLIFMMDPQGRYQYVNETAARIFGLPQEDLIGKSQEELFAPERARRNREALALVFQGQLVPEMDEWYEFPTGRRCLATRLIPLQDEKGAIRSVLGIGQDMTERMQALDRLQLDQQRLEVMLQLTQMEAGSLREITDFALNAAVRLTRSRIGYLAFLNEDETVLTMHAWSKEAMAECQVANVPFQYPVEKTGLWGEAVRQRRPVITNDYSEANPLKKGLPLGHVALHRHMNVPVFERDRLVAVAGVGNKAEPYDDTDVQQITLLMSGMWQLLRHRRVADERRKAVDALLESEERFRLLIQHSQDMITVLDEEGRLKYQSPTIAQSLGYEASAITGKYVFSVIHPDDRRHVEAMFTAIKQGKHIGTPVEYRGRHANGSWVWLESIASNQIAHTRMGGIIVNTRDCSERRKAQETKIQLEAQLRQAQKLEAIGTLAGGIAHDFNNILGAVMGYASLAREDLSIETEGHQCLSEILKAGQRAKDLIQQILTFSRQQEQSFSPFKIQPVIQEAAKLLRASIPSTIEMRLDLQADKALVFGDPSQIHQVLLNLATNAAQAMRDQAGILSVSLTTEFIDADTARRFPDLKEGPYLRLAVSDTGIGMEPAVQERIFDPFFTTKPKGEGTGLGLALVHGIVKSHQGAIQLSSVVGVGTTFTLFFPVYRKNTILEPPDSPQIVRGSGQHVLVIDDEASLVLMGRKMLLRLGYRVTSCTSSIEALDLFRTRPQSFDLIITDQTMPRLTGCELIGKIREIEPHTPVVLMTGFHAGVTSEKLAALGIHHLMMKPYTMETLARMTHQALESIQK